MKMKMMKALAVMSMAAVMLTGCGEKKSEETSSVPQTLPVEVQTGTVSYYKETDKDAPLVPKTKLKLHGVDFGVCTLNIEAFNFREKSFKEFLEQAGGDVNASKTKQIDNDDFSFFGFAVGGSNPNCYVELVKDGELVKTYDKNDIGNYKIKALYTSAEMLGADGGSYIIFGARLFIGLSKTDIEMTDGKGYTSGYDNNTFYYPDDAGCTLALTYKPAEGNAEVTSGGAQTEGTSEGAGELVLSELFFFME